MSITWFRACRQWKATSSGRGVCLSHGLSLSVFSGPSQSPASQCLLLACLYSFQYAFRWTLEAKLKGIPGQRKLVITGSSLYTLADAGVFAGQLDTWDAVPGGAQLDSIAFLLRNALSLQLTPDLDTPQYSVLKKTREYEIRRYESFLIAEVDMPPSVSPASGVQSYPLVQPYRLCASKTACRHPKLVC